MIVIFLLCLLLLLHASGSLSKGRGLIFLVSPAGRWDPVLTRRSSSAAFFFFRFSFFGWLWFVINLSRCMGDEGMLEESNSWNTPFGSGPGRGHRSLLGYISPFSQNGHCFFFC